MKSNSGRFLPSHLSMNDMEIFQDLSVADRNGRSRGKSPSIQVRL